MTGLEKILAQIADDAEADAQKQILAAKEECRRIAEACAAEGIAARDRVIANAEKEGESVVSRTRSAAEMDRRNLLLFARAEMIDRAFDRAAEKIREKNFGKYRALLSTLLLCALADIARAEQESAALGDEVEPYDCIEVLLNAEDHATFGQTVINDARRNADKRVRADQLQKLVLSEECAAIDGGIILRCGNIETNCSLSTLIGELRREMEGEVAAILFPNAE